MRVCLDAGHGGADPGACGQGLREKDLVLRLMEQVAAGCAAAGLPVVKTRSDDRTVSLPERAAMANRAGAAVLVSLHANAATTPAAHGTEVWHQDGDDAGQALAETLVQHLHQQLPQHRHRGVKSGDWHILRETTMPAALVECEFLTNPAAAQLLSDPAWGETCAAALVQGLIAYGEAAGLIAGPPTATPGGSMQTATPPPDARPAFTAAQRALITQLKLACAGQIASLLDPGGHGKTPAAARAEAADFLATYIHAPDGEQRLLAAVAATGSRPAPAVPPSEPPLLLGHHFLDRDYRWDQVAQHTIPFIELVYATNGHAGYTLPETLARLAELEALLRDHGKTPYPLVRLDYAPGETLRDTAAYYDTFRALGAATDAPIIVGNEPNLPSEGLVPLAVVGAVLARCLAIKQAAGGQNPVLAPAIAPWAPYNVQDPADFYPCARPAATEWENWQYGLARRCRPLPITGYALHVYGRPAADELGADEPGHAGVALEARGAEWGVGWWRDALAAIRAGDDRALDLHITECNVRTDHASDQCYPRGWLPQLLAALRESGAPIRTLCWFVGRADSPHWLGESLHHRQGRIADAADDFATLL